MAMGGVPLGTLIAKAQMQFGLSEFGIPLTVIASLEREIEKLQLSVILNKDIIVDVLENFDALFVEASNDEKRAFLRALIKEIHMEADRKSIKNIVFWFTEDDSFTHFALPVSDVGRTES